jgi:hypothetical protein
MNCGRAFSLVSNLRRSYSVPPIAHEFLNRRQLHALRLIFDGLLLGQARRRDAPAEVVQVLFRNVDAEGADRDAVGPRGRLCAGLVYVGPGGGLTGHLRLLTLAGSREAIALGQQDNQDRATTVCSRP